MIICLPPFGHSDEVQLAAERGIHLLIEKPIALEAMLSTQLAVMRAQSAMSFTATCSCVVCTLLMPVVGLMISRPLHSLIKMLASVMPPLKPMGSTPAATSGHHTLDERMVRAVLIRIADVLDLDIDSCAVGDSSIFVRLGDAIRNPDQRVRPLAPRRALNLDAIGHCTGAQAAVDHADVGRSTLVDAAKLHPRNGLRGDKDGVDAILGVHSRVRRFSVDGGIDAIAAGSGDDEGARRSAIS